MKSRLKASIEQQELNPDFVTNAQFEYERHTAIKDVVNEEVGHFLRSLLDSFISLLLMYEFKLKKETLGNMHMD